MKAVVESVAKATPSVALLRLKPDQPFDFRPGQFCTVPIERDGRRINKSYSIASHPSVRDYIELCIKIVEGGFVSNYLANLQPGTELEIRGPFGHFTLQEHDNDLVFVATGTGISGLKPMIDDVFMRAPKHDVWLLLGVRTEQDIVYRKELEQLARKFDNFHFIPVLSDSSSPDFEHGYVQDAFRKLISLKGQDVYICGLYVMVDEVRQMCFDMGFPPSKVHFEKYI